MSVNFETIIKNVLDISTIDSTRYVAPYKQTRWIVGSSCLFLIPSVYGYSCEQYLLATVALLTSMFSVNFGGTRLILTEEAWIVLWLKYPLLFLL